MRKPRLEAKKEPKGSVLVSGRNTTGLETQVFLKLELVGSMLYLLPKHKDTSVMIPVSAKAASQNLIL